MSASPLCELRAALLAAMVLVASQAQGQAQHSNEDAFKALAGRWHTKQGRYSTNAADPAFADQITDWTGAVYGVVRPAGQILFKGGNGGVITAMTSPLTTSAHWVFSGRLEGCTTAHLNQRIFGNLRKDGDELVIEAGEVPFAMGRPPVSFFFKARMRLY